jgi:hypothetical protein
MEADETAQESSDNEAHDKNEVIREENVDKLCFET